MVWEGQFEVKEGGTCLRTLAMQMTKSITFLVMKNVSAPIFCSLLLSVSALQTKICVCDISLHGNINTGYLYCINAKTDPKHIHQLIKYTDVDTVNRAKAVLAVFPHSVSTS